MRATVALLLSGFLAAVLLTRESAMSVSDGPIGGVDPSDVVLAGAVIAAGLVAALTRRAPLVSALGIGAALVAGGSLLIASPGTAEPIGTIAGGVLLGASAVLAGASTGRLAWLAAATVGGLFVGGLVESLDPGRSEVPRRYAEYLVASEQPTPVVVPILAVLTALAWVWAAPHRRAPSRPAPPAERRVRVLLAVVVVPAAGLLVRGLFDPPAYGDGPGVAGFLWFGLVAVPLLVAAVALVPDRGGVPILAGTAVLAASSTSAAVGIDVGAGPAWTVGVVLVVLAVIVLGAGLGRRWPRPSVGIGVLVLVCLSSLIDGPLWDNLRFVASLLVLPAASAFLVASIARTTRPGTPTGWALGLAVPLTIAVPAVHYFGWTAYTPVTPLEPPIFSILGDVVAPLGVVVGTVLLAGIGIALSGRRAS